MGSWAYDCASDSDYSGYVNFLTKDKVIINAADNQIYLIASVISSEDVFSLYYKSADVGRGGMDIDWGKVSIKHPIATLKRLNDDKLYFNWIGLQDVEKNMVEILFTSFPHDKKRLTLVRCIEQG